MTQHTPTPYEIETVKDDGVHYYRIVNAEGKTIVDTLNSGVAVVHQEDHRWDEQGRQDAAFIVKACNAHDNLLAWKKDAMTLLTAYDEIAETCPGKLGSRKIENLRKEMARLREVNAGLLAACKIGLARIESDVESTERYVPDGDLIRAAINKTKGA